jgi:hypothetical protein
MPVDLNVDFDKNKYASLMRKIELLANEKEINKVISKAAKKAADEARKETLNLIPAQYTVPKSEVEGTIETQKIGGGEKGAVMHIASDVFPLYKFGGVLPREIMPPAKGPVRAAVKQGGGADLSRAFVAKMPNGHVGVYEREGSKRKSKDSHGREKRGSVEHNHINELFGPSVPGMFGREKDTEINMAVMEKAGEVFNKRVIVELERLMYG